MKGKVWIYRFMLLAGVCMALGFIAEICVDAKQHQMYALPFHFLVLLHAVELLLPALFLIIIGLILRRKKRRVAEQSR